MILSNQVLQIVFRTRNILERRKEGLLKAGNLGLGSNHIDRRECALRDQTLVVLELRVCVADCVSLHLEISQSKHQVPISALHAADRFNSSLTELSIR